MAKFKPTNTEVKALTFPKGFHRHNLSALEVELYCMGYDKCKENHRVVVSELIAEIAELKADKRELEKLVKRYGPKKKTLAEKNSALVTVRENEIKARIISMTGKSMKNIQIQKSGNWKVDIKINGQRFTQTFSDLSMAKDYRDELRMQESIHKDNTLHLTPEQEEVLEKARIIREEVMLEQMNNDRRSANGKRSRKYLTPFNEESKEKAKETVKKKFSDRQAKAMEDHKAELVRKREARIEKMQGGQRRTNKNK